MQEPRTEPRTDSFKTLKAKLAAKGAENPAALAAWICRKKGEGKGKGK